MPYGVRHKMGNEHTSPDQLMKEADTTLKETETRLRELLHKAAGQMDPFPYFHGSHSIKAVEAEPPKGQTAGAS